MTGAFSSADLEVLRNRTFDEIVVGDCASIGRTLTAADVQLFAAMSGAASIAALFDSKSTNTPILSVAQALQ